MKRREAGFTLVELLIALTLLGFLSVALFGGLRFGARSWTAIDSASARQEEIALSQTFLRDRLGQISAVGPPIDGKLPPTLEIAGKADRIAFAAPWLSPLGQGRLFIFTLWHDPAGDGALMIQWRPADEDIVDSESLTGERALIRGVQAVQITYFGQHGKADVLNWQHRWNSQTKTPRMVRLTVELSDAQQAWPDLTIALRRET
ncbi:MAG: prepilin-type N-terminal cleavage/methylation domain-containing protein [Alphaproteobacteria bacterium]